MRKYLFRLYARRGAEFFHIRPTFAAVYRFARARDEYAAACKFMFFYIAVKDSTQPVRQKNRSGLSFQTYLRLFAAYRFDSDKLQLGHAYSRAADSLQNQI